MITTDRGLAGSLNANAIRAALRWTQARVERPAGALRRISQDACGTGSV